MGNAAQHCRLELFEDSDFAGDLEDSKSATGGFLCNFGSRTFVAISWMCKKQTSVSHSSTESEIISLDAGLRVDGLLALDLWGTTPRIPTRTRACTWETGAKTQSTPKTKQVSDQNVDLSHHRSSSFERTSLRERITVVHFRRQRSCDKDAHQRQKSDDETCVSHPLSCSGLVV